MPCPNCGYIWPKAAIAEFMIRNKPIDQCPVICPTCNYYIQEIPREGLEQHSTDGKILF